MNDLIETLKHLEKRIKLTLTVIYKLTELLLRKCYFLYENNLCLLQSSGPTGISLMVVLLECYLKKIKCKAKMEALNYKIAPKTCRRFVDDSYVRFLESSHANKLLDILNKKDPAITNTVEFQDYKHSLDFLDINIINNTTNRKI